MDQCADQWTYIYMNFFPPAPELLHLIQSKARQLGLELPLEEADMSGPWHYTDLIDSWGVGVLLFEMYEYMYFSHYSSSHHFNCSL